MCFGIDPSHLKDLSSGAIEDPLVDKMDMWASFAFQKINCTSLREGLDVMPKIATIVALQLNMAALTETNIHSN